ncbi:MAG: hypothetical protein ACRDRN_26075 [Sciscionella sp.]
MDGVVPAGMVEELTAPLDGGALGRVTAALLPQPASAAISATDVNTWGIRTAA